MRGTMIRAYTDRLRRLPAVRLAYGPSIPMTGGDGARRMATHVGAERLRAEIARLEAERES